MVTNTVRAEVRPPAVAGSFYAGNAAQLESDVPGYLRAGAAAGGPPVALIAPHAGYVFSGATAGKAFAALAGAKLTRVILLGPSHHADFSGGALPSPGITAFATPLGEMPVDREAVARAREVAGVRRAGARPRPRALPRGRAAVPAGHRRRGADRPDHRRRTPPTGRSRSPWRGAWRSWSGPAPWWWCPRTSPTTARRTATSRSPPTARFRPTLVALARSTAGRAAAVDPRGFSQQIDASGDTVCGARPITVLLELLAHAFQGTGAVADVTTSAAMSAATCRRWSPTPAWTSPGAGAPGARTRRRRV